MEDLLDMIIADESPSQISNKIKDLLFTKSAQKIDEFRPSVSSSMFNSADTEEGESE